MLAVVSQNQTLYPFSPSWLFGGVSGVLAAGSQDPWPFAFSWREEVHCVSVWVRNFPSRQVSGLRAQQLLTNLRKPNHLPTHDIWDRVILILKKHCFFGRAIAV